MKQHVNRVASTCFFHLYHLRQLKRYVTLHTMKHLVSALILSRLDYCNSALAGLTWSTTRVDPRGSDQMHAFSVNNPLLKGPQPTTNISTRSIIWRLESTEISLWPGGSAPERAGRVQDAPPDNLVTPPPGAMTGNVSDKDRVWTGYSDHGLPLLSISPPCLDRLSMTSQRLQMSDHAGSSRTTDIFRQGSSDFASGNVWKGRPASSRLRRSF